MEYICEIDHPSKNRFVIVKSYLAYLKVFKLFYSQQKAFNYRGQFRIYDYFTIISGLAGTIICKLHVFLNGCALNAAILTLAVIAADRFIAIFFPLRRAINSRKAIWLIAATWFVPALPGTILLYVNRIYEFRILRCRCHFVLRPSFVRNNRLLQRYNLQDMDAQNPGANDDSQSTARNESKKERA